MKYCKSGGTDIDRARDSSFAEEHINGEALIWICLKGKSYGSWSVLMGFPLRKDASIGYSVSSIHCEPRLKYLPLVWNGLWRNRARTLFTPLSVTVAFILFGILAGVDAGFAHSLEASRMDRLFADPKFGAPMREIDGATFGADRLPVGVSPVAHARAIEVQTQ
jgi:hypothetical protein